MIREVDARNLPCPQPVLRVKEALEELPIGSQIKVLIDSEVSLANLKKFLSAQGHKIISLDTLGSEFHLLIEKGSPSMIEDYTITCEPVEKESPLLIIVASDHLGEDKELGKLLLKGFFETLLANNFLPYRIFFMNTGVKLTTLEQSFIEILVELEKRGVEILSCGTCLKHYGLENSLKVGYRGGSESYIEPLFSSTKVIYLR
ncbi:MAG: sulfurtransferase-like selenium metabolism protein YedF [Caldimicrobium sp.]|nr:sulfurtransferase-like selenium metabolism protein YedF [Caldimicrobium sp.]MCX7873840.1 sulfurtransferase-like selenium metabolism protein YedF [Caldimicrobium sp.]MDW8095075.1 sulfurtransferase-like selenium metabolism protein YedF [Caldimicrobium sp.]